MTRRHQYRPTHPPDWCTPAVVARRHWPGIRSLEGVIDYPVLCADGTVVAHPCGRREFDVRCRRRAALFSRPAKVADRAQVAPRAGRLLSHMTIKLGIGATFISISCA